MLLHDLQKYRPFAHDDEGGSAFYMGICRFAPEGVARRIDIKVLRRVTCNVLWPGAFPHASVSVDFRGSRPERRLRLRWAPVA